MELKKLVKSTSFLVISKIVQFVIGVIRSKLGAVYIGTTGVGIFTQVNYLVNMISNLTLLSMNDGLVKQIVQERESVNYKEILKGLLKAYISLILFVSFIAIIICIIFAKPLTIFFLGDEKYLTYFLFGVTCIPITIFNSVSFALLKSYKATRYIARANVTSALITIVIYVPLIYYFRITGAIISIAINYFAQLILNKHQANKLILSQIGLNLLDISKSIIRRKHLKELLYFAFFGATTGLVMLLSDSFCRSIVVNSLGISKIGLYSPITTWAGVFTGFIVPSLNLYLYPRFSECKTDEEISGILNDALRLVSFIMIPLLFLAIPFRNIIIPIFYSQEFIEAEKYLPWHFIGLVFYVWWIPMTQMMTPTGKIKIHGIFITIMSIVNIAIVYIYVPLYGLYGWMLKFIVSPVIFFLIYYIYISKVYSFKIIKQNILIMTYLLTASFIIIALDGFFVRYFSGFLFLVLSYFFLTVGERQFIFQKLKKIIKKNKTKN